MSLCEKKKERQGNKTIHQIIRWNFLFFVMTSLLFVLLFSLFQNHSKRVNLLRGYVCAFLLSSRMNVREATFQCRPTIIRSHCLNFSLPIVNSKRLLLKLCIFWDQVRLLLFRHGFKKTNKEKRQEKIEFVAFWTVSVRCHAYEQHRIVHRDELRLALTIECTKRNKKKWFIRKDSFPKFCHFFIRHNVQRSWNKTSAPFSLKKKPSHCHTTIDSLSIIQTVLLVFSCPSSFTWIIFINVMRNSNSALVFFCKHATWCSANLLYDLKLFKFQLSSESASSKSFARSKSSLSKVAPIKARISLR